MSEELNKPVETNVYPRKREKKPIIKRIIVVSLAAGIVFLGGRFACKKYQEYRETIYNPEQRVENGDVDKYKETGKKIKTQLEKEGDLKLSHYFFNNEEDGTISLYCVMKSDNGPVGVSKYIVDAKGTTALDECLDVISNSNLTTTEHYYYNMMNIYSIEENKLEYMSEIKEYFKDDWTYVGAQNGYCKKEANYDTKTVEWTVGCWVKIKNKTSVKIFHYEWKASMPFIDGEPDYDFKKVLNVENALKVTKYQEMGENFIKTAYINMGLWGNVFEDVEEYEGVTDIYDGNWKIKVNDDLTK